MGKKYFFLLVSTLLVQYCFGQVVQLTNRFTDTSFDALSINQGLAVGSTAGSADIANGSASYIIPLEVPAGTNGVVPSLSLAYNNHQGDGHLGHGWSVSGMSSISRNLKTLYFDNEVEGVKLSSSDALYIDGVRMLPDGGNQYQKEIEDYSQIERHGSLTSSSVWFEVTTKEGVKIEFGNGNNSAYLTEDGLQVLVWSISKIRYLDGNYITFEYSNTDRDHRITRINYTGNDITGLTPYNQINFHYADRGEYALTTYEGESKVVLKYILESIEIESESQSFRTYNLEYGTDDLTLSLKSVQEEGIHGSRLNPTYFKYGNTSVDQEVRFMANVDPATKDMFTADINGDGYTDMILANKVLQGNSYYHDSYSVWRKAPSNVNNGFFHAYDVQLPYLGRISSSGNTYNFYSGDITGDGKDDVVSAFSQSTGYVDVRQANLIDIHETNSTATGMTTTSLAIPSGGGLRYFNTDHKNFVQGDFDGDSRMDLILIVAEAIVHATATPYNYHAYIYYGGGSANFQEIQISGNHQYGIEDWNVEDINVVDMNGDGRAELMITGTTHSEWFELDGTSATSTNGWGTGFPTRFHLMFFGDFNGDRKTDILTRAGTHDINADWEVVYSDGDSFGGTPLNFFWVSSQPDINADYIGDLVAIGDFNGDGKSDIGRGYNDVGHVIQQYMSKGDDFFYQGYTHNAPIENTTGVSDFNGDGRSEIGIRNTTTNFFFAYYYRPRGEELLLDKVKDGHFHVTDFGYEIMTDEGTYYIRDKELTYPYNVAKVPMYLAHFISKKGITSSYYTYKNAILHRNGKGFLGFDEVRRRSNDSHHLSERTQYYLDDTHALLYPDTILHKRFENLLNEKVITTDITSLNTANGFPYFKLEVSATLDNNVLEGKTTSTSTVFDNYSNALTSTIDINGIESTTTTQTYGQHGGLVPHLPLLIENTTSRDGMSYTTKDEFNYNAISQLTSKVQFKDLPQTITETYGYNSFGNRNTTDISAVNMITRSSSQIYDTKGRYALQSTNTLGQTSSSLYHISWAKPTQTTGINGLITNYTYDDFGRLNTTTPAQGYVIDNNYSWTLTGGHVYKHEVLHPGHGTTTQYFDDLGRVVREDETGFNLTKTSTTEYNNRGLVEMTVSPTGFTTTNTYDTYAQLISSTDDFGTTSYIHAYSNGEKTTTMTNAASQVSSTKTDASGKVVESTDYGGTLNFTYHPSGTLATTTSNGTVLSEVQYDDYARKHKLMDVDAGTMEYNYDAFGQLIYQKNARGQETTMTYDQIGRMDVKTIPEGTVTHTYFGSGLGASTNQIQSITSFEGDTESFTYDTFGRLATKSHLIDGSTYTSSYTYDQFDRIDVKTYPSGFATKSNYDANGYITTIVNNATPSIKLFENFEMNALDQLKDYRNGPGTGLRIKVTYNHGYPTLIDNGSISDFIYTWDYASGNLDSRNIKLNTTDHIENFLYDNMNRLTSHQVSGQAAFTTNYQGNGNINVKSDAGGAYSYHQDKIHAITGVSGPNYTHLSIYNQDVSYTSFEQTSQIKEHDDILQYTYGSDMQRLKSVHTEAGVVASTRLYLGDYEIIEEGNTIRHLHYLNYGRGIDLIVEQEGSTTNYWRCYLDHQGSIRHITKQAGFNFYYDYDAWGRRRDANTQSYAVGANPVPWMTRGYTGHEHLDDFKLINMNGRLYDPVLGRMLSPDNYVQSPYSTQSYNRYSYVINNPLKYTDPSGEIIVPMLIGAAIGVVANGISNVARHNKFFDGAGKAAIFGAIGGGLSSGIGAVANEITNSATKMAFQALAHGWSGAMLGMAQGGHPLQGLASSVASSVVGSGVSEIGSSAGGIIIGGALAGGVGAKVAGGDFWEGAGRGLIVGGLNHAAHSLTKPDDFIYLLDKEGVMNTGVGHSAMLIQDENGKWHFRSKAGSNIDGVAKVDIGTYDSPEQFYNSEQGKRYESRARIPLSLAKSQKVLDAVNAASKTKYNFITNNCDHMCKAGLRAAGIYHNNSTLPVFNWESVTHSGVRRFYYYGK